MKLTAQGGEPCIKVYDRRMKSDLSKRADPGREIFYIRESVCASERRPRGKSVGGRVGRGKRGRAWKKAGQEKVYASKKRESSTP